MQQFDGYDRTHNSAAREPAGMRVHLTDGTSVPIRHGWVAAPQEDDSERAERMELAIGH